jgi:hypothetical protein
LYVFERLTDAKKYRPFIGGCLLSREQVGPKKGKEEKREEKGKQKK